MYSAVFGCNVLCVSIPFDLMCCPESLCPLNSLTDLHIDVSRVLRAAIITVLLSISPFRYVSTCCRHFGPPLLGV